jgi:ribosomal protein L16 Arg81 hydroxylase
MDIKNIYNKTAYNKMISFLLNKQNAEPYIVDLEAGDVLYVPHNWWHYVESLTTSISINTWVELDV